MLESHSPRRTTIAHSFVELNEVKKSWFPVGSSESTTWWWKPASVSWSLINWHKSQPLSADESKAAKLAWCQYPSFFGYSKEVKIIWSKSIELQSLQSMMNKRLGCQSIIEDSQRSLLFANPHARLSPPIFSTAAQFWGWLLWLGTETAADCDSDEQSTCRSKVMSTVRTITRQLKLSWHCPAAWSLLHDVCWCA